MDKIKSVLPIAAALLASFHGMAHGVELARRAYRGVSNWYGCWYGTYLLWWACTRCSIYVMCHMAKIVVPVQHLLQ